MARLRCSLTAETVSTTRNGTPWSWAVLINALVSLGKHEPPKPGPAWRNFAPMRLSRPMPRATSCTSAPTCSHRSAISLMNVILVARNAFEAYLIIQIERPIDLGEHVACARVVGTDDDAVGMLEILDGGAFAQEFRIGYDLNVGV